MDKKFSSNRYMESDEVEPYFWDEIVKEYMQIRGSVKQEDFCNKHYINHRTFKHHLYKHPDYIAYRDSKCPSFIDVKVADDECSKHVPQGSSSTKPFTLIFKDYNLMIPADFEQSSLQRIVEVLS